jgi:integrase
MAGSKRLKAGQRGVWELRIFLGRDEQGRVRHKSVTFRGGSRAADKELTRLVAKYEGTLPAAEAPVRWTDTTTVNDAITAWKQNGWQDLSPTTVRHYQELWDKHIKRSIGRREIARLNPYEVERYFRRLKDDGTGRTTVRHIRAMLNRACRLARKWSANTLPNPIVDTELPVWPLGERGEPVRSPDLAEVHAILAAASAFDERFGAFVRLVAATGVRRGEACALRWNDIDWESGTILVDESVVAASGGAEVKAPKTKASIRRLALDPATVEMLRTLRISQEELAAMCEVEIGPDGFVFSYEPGSVEPPHPDTMSHEFTKVRTKAKAAKDIHLHSLRHFQATALDRVVPERQKQARLGWATVHMARHYTDVIAGEDLRAAEHIGHLLEGEGAAPGPTDPQTGQLSAVGVD